MSWLGVNRIKHVEGFEEVLDAGYGLQIPEFRPEQVEAEVELHNESEAQEVIPTYDEPSRRPSEYALVDPNTLSRTQREAWAREWYAAHDFSPYFFLGDAVTVLKPEHALALGVAAGVSLDQVVAPCLEPILPVFTLDMAARHYGHEETRAYVQKCFVGCGTTIDLYARQKAEEQKPHFVKTPTGNFRLDRDDVREIGKQFQMCPNPLLRELGLRIRSYATSKRRFRLGELRDFAARKIGEAFDKLYPVS